MIEMKCCPRCGSFDCAYTGVDDGGGDYGSAVCDNYECEACGYCWEEHCLEYDDDDLADDLPADFIDTDSVEGFDVDAYSNKDIRDDIGDIPF